jgi:hypothetical protein
MVIGMHHIMLSSLVLASSAASVEPQKPATQDDFSDSLQAPVDASDGMNFRTGFLIEEWGAEADVEFRVFPGQNVEVIVSLVGEPHIIIASDGNDYKRVWLSERAKETGLLFEFLQHVGSDEVLSEVRKNPACGVFKWGMTVVLTAGVVACCTNVIACFGCTLVGNDTQKKIDGIDCNKECKPECPI